MRKLWVLLLCFIAFQSIGYPQDTIQKKLRYLYLEGGGNGGLYSLNYEGIAIPLLKTYPNSFNISWNAGFSLLPFSGRAVVDFPVSIAYVAYMHAGKFGAELGTGQTLILDLGGGKGGTIRGTFRYGIRYRNKKYCWRITYTPFYSYINNFQFEHWFGISYGRSF